MERISQLWTHFSDSHIYDGNVIVRTLAGSGDGHSRDGRATEAAFGDPLALCVDSNDKIYVTDGRNHRIRVVSPFSGEVTTLVGNPKTEKETLDMYGQNSNINWPAGILHHPTSDHIVVSSRYSHRICEVHTPTGAVSNIAGAQGGYFNGPNSATRFRLPRGLAFDRNDPNRIFVCDQANHCIRLIDRNGQNVQTFAGTGKAGYRDGAANQALFKCPRGLAVGPLGEVYVADGHNNCIRKIFDNVVTTVAGQPTKVAGWCDGEGSMAMFNDPMSICVAEAGSVLYVADRANHVIRKIRLENMAEASVSTVAGCPDKGYEDGSGDAAKFNRPTGIAIGSDGTLYVADSGNGRIRSIVPDEDSDVEETYIRLENAVANKMRDKDRLRQDIKNADKNAIAAATAIEETRIATIEAEKDVVSLQVRLKETQRFLKTAIVQRTRDLARLREECGALAENKDASDRNLAQVQEELLAEQHVLACVNEEKNKMSMRLQSMLVTLRCFKRSDGEDRCADDTASGTVTPDTNETNAETSEAASISDI